MCGKIQCHSHRFSRLGRDPEHSFARAEGGGGVTTIGEGIKVSSFRSKSENCKEMSLLLMEE